LFAHITVTNALIFKKGPTRYYWLWSY